jgi:hypothetical protein
VILPNGVELPAGIVPVVVTADYYIGLERYSEQVTLIHSIVFARWSARLARELRAWADAIVSSHDGPIYAATHQPHNGDPVKWAKFVRLMGFDAFATVRGTDGADHAVFVRRS